MRAHERRSSVSSNGGLSGGKTSIGAPSRGSIGAGSRSSIGPGSRSSIGAGGRTSIGAASAAAAGVSGIPRAGMSRISAVRAANTQPAFDFLTGVERGSVRSHNDENEGAGNAGAGKERDREVGDLRAEIKTLKYTISTREQEVELAKIRQESEVREVRRKGEEDFRKMQVADGERIKAARAVETMGKELQQVKNNAENERAALERRLRDGEEERRVLREEVEDVKTEREEMMRGLERRVQELEERNRALTVSIKTARSEADEKEGHNLRIQQRMTERDAEVGTLESEILRLKTQTGDADTLGVIKRELGEQVAHIRTLEVINREQQAELKHFRQLHKSVEIVEEEKRTLQRKVDAMEDLQQELGEARLQRQRLEDERLAWTAFLQSQTGEDGEPEFDSPEALARALVHERLEAATLLEKLGGIEPAISEKEEIIKSLEREKAKLEGQLEKAKNNGGGDVKTRNRIDRQRALAVKEVEYLRAQLKTFDAEESTMELKSYDEQKAQRIQQLEDMVDQYRKEVQKVHEELSTIPVNTPSGEALSTKRPREEPADHEQLGQLSRKNRKLQDELSTAQNAISVLRKELSVAQERLNVATQHNKTRILSLRSNPTSDVEAIKLSTLASLKDENAALLSQLRTGNPNTAVIPISTLEAAQRDVRDMAKMVADKEKQMARLKQIWGAKAAEFREGVSSLLGWQVEFLPSGKMKVSSVFYPSSEDSENSIVFDGSNETMKISGGPRSLFARKISDQIKFWLTERGEIPCLLAALTLEFYEETTKAAAH